MSKKLSEAEVRFRILQALELSPRLTIGMLQAFLTSRVPNNVRDTVLGIMAKEGRVRFESRVFHSFYGHTSVVKVVVSTKPQQTLSSADFSEVEKRELAALAANQAEV